MSKPIGFWRIVGATLLGEGRTLDLMRKVSEEHGYEDRKIAAANALIRSDGVVAQAEQTRRQRGSIDKILVDAGHVFVSRDKE